MTAISIIIPAFHAQEFITRAVRSVLAQEYADWEMVIIADDGQDYRPILEGQGVDCRRIVFASTGAMGSGPAHARNIGLEHASGRIIATLDADDEFLPGKLPRMVPKALEYGLCSCVLEFAEFGADGQLRLLPLPRLAQAEGPLAAALYPIVNYSMSSMILFDRERCPMRWPENLPVMEDIVFAMQAYDYIDTAWHEPHPLHRYVRRPHSLSCAPDTPQCFIAAKQQILSLLVRDDCPIRSSAARAALHSFIALSLATERTYAEALQRGETPVFSAMLAETLAKEGITTLK